MRKTTNNHIFLVRNVLCVTHGWRIGARERGKFGERTLRIGERFVNNWENREGELRRDINDL